MSKFIVTKIIDFCYGHRLLNYDGKCKHLHGHNARVEIDIGASTLDEHGIAHDFGDIKKAIKNWIDEVLDHRMLLNKEDPLIYALFEGKEPLFLMEGNPTAENIAKLIFEEAKKMGLPVDEVRLWETPDSFATYRS